MFVRQVLYIRKSHQELLHAISKQDDSPLSEVARSLFDRALQDEIVARRNSLEDRVQ
jgi:hypothetical protein